MQKQIIFTTLFFACIIYWMCWNDADQLVEKLGKDKTIILILGPHRSGTSALTHAISECIGFPMTRHEVNEKVWIQPTKDEPNGWWEYKEIVEIQEDLLKKLQNRTDGNDVLGILPRDWMEREETLYGLDRLHKVLSDEMVTLDKLLIKDPRTALLLPLWIKLSVELKVKLLFIFSLRNPNLVAASMHRRQNMSIEVGKKMWYRHTMDSIEGTRGRFAMILDYDDNLRDCRLKELESILNKPVDCNCVSRILSVNHRHHTTGLELIDQYDYLYKELLELSRGWKQVKDGSKRLMKLWNIYHTPPTPMVDVVE